MAKIIEKHHVHCGKRHVGAFVIKCDDGSLTVKRGFLKQCGDSYPFLKDANYRGPFRRAPEYRPK